MKAFWISIFVFVIGIVCWQKAHANFVIHATEASSTHVAEFIGVINPAHNVEFIPNFRAELCVGRWGQRGIRPKFYLSRFAGLKGDSIHFDVPLAVGRGLGIFIGPEESAESFLNDGFGPADIRYGEFADHFIVHKEQMPVAGIDISGRFQEAISYPKTGPLGQYGLTLAAFPEAPCCTPKADGGNAQHRREGRNGIKEDRLDPLHYTPEEGFNYACWLLGGGALLVVGGILVAGRSIRWPQFIGGLIYGPGCLLVMAAIEGLRENLR